MNKLKYLALQFTTRMSPLKIIFCKVAPIVHTIILDERWVRQPISPKKRMAIAIYKLASQAEYRTVAHVFGVSKSSVHNCLMR